MPSYTLYLEAHMSSESHLIGTILPLAAALLITIRMQLPFSSTTHIIPKISAPDHSLHAMSMDIGEEADGGGFVRGVWEVGVFYVAVCNRGSVTKVVAHFGRA